VKRVNAESFCARKGVEEKDPTDISRSALAVTPTRRRIKKIYTIVLIRDKLGKVPEEKEGYQLEL
jgi:hypothetical protein